MMQILYKIRRRSILAGLLIGTLFMIIYSYNIDLSMKKHQNNIVYHNNHSYYNEGSIISNSGCRIPNLHFNEKIKSLRDEDRSFSCGLQAINVRKDANKSYFQIDENVMKSLLNGTQLSHCCYYEITRKENKDKEIDLSPCKQFGKSPVEIIGNNDFYVVECFADQDKKVYWDSFAILRRYFPSKYTTRVKNRVTVDMKKTTEDGVSTKTGKTLNESCSKHIPDRYSLLVLGIDTMSRWRLHTTMPSTTSYLKQNGWFEFKGYQKVGLNTFPNIMAVLTGLNPGRAYKLCRDSIEPCKDMFVWRRFAAAGYTTAYGEDTIKMPDTFHRGSGFGEQPTHHYMRPLFIAGESKITLDDKVGICSGSLLSGEKILTYATDFATAYKNSSSFGFFWMNSFSHDDSMSPTIMDSKMIKALERLKNDNITENTVIIVLGDHGVRFGLERQTLASYYDERLPALLMWIPNSLQRMYPKLIKNLKINEGRLVTPYDLHLTLHDLLAMSCGEKFLQNPPLACPKCRSLFKEIPSTRKCKDAAVDKKWCTCHDAKPISQSYDTHYMKIVNYFIDQIQLVVSKEMLKPCYICAKQTIKKIMRIDYYKENNNSLNIVAIQTLPGEVMFEATLMELSDDSLQLVGEIDVISVNNGNNGNCVKNIYKQPYCFCQHQHLCEISIL